MHRHRVPSEPELFAGEATREIVPAHNFYPARVYMGEAALFLGFLLSVIGLKLELIDAPKLVASFVPILVLMGFALGVAAFFGVILGRVPVYETSRRPRFVPSEVTDEAAGSRDKTASA